MYNSYNYIYICIYTLIVRNLPYKTTWRRSRQRLIDAKNRSNKIRSRAGRFFLPYKESFRILIRFVVTNVFMRDPMKIVLIKPSFRPKTYV